MTNKDRPIRAELTAYTLGQTSGQLRVQCNQIFNNAAQTATEQLKAITPVGATGQLQEGWRVTPARRNTVGFDTTVVISNTAPKAYNRLHGRPGGMAPPIEPLERWVRAKHPEERHPRRVAKAIAISIAKRGTERWRENKPVLGLHRDGSIEPDSPIGDAQVEIEKQLLRIRLPF